MVGGAHYPGSCPTGHCLTSFPLGSGRGGFLLTLGLQ